MEISEFIKKWEGVSYQHKFMEFTNDLDKTVTELQKSSLTEEKGIADIRRLYEFLIRKIALDLTGDNNLTIKSAFAILSRLGFMRGDNFSEDKDPFKEIGYCTYSLLSEYGSHPNVSDAVNKNYAAKLCIDNITLLMHWLSKNSVVIAGHLNQGESIQLDPKEELRFVDIQVDRNKSYTENHAIFQFEGEPFKLKAGQIKQLKISNFRYVLAVKEVVAGYTFGAKYVKFVIFKKEF